MSPDGDDPIFIGINRLVAKGLAIDEQEKGTEAIQYPCQIANRFQCPYERTNINEIDDFEDTDSPFSVEDLFRLQRMAFVVEIALAEARKDDSEIRIKDKQDLFYALTDKNTLTKMLHQADDIFKSREHLKQIAAGQDINYLIDYFTRVKDHINLNELRLY